MQPWVALLAIACGALMVFSDGYCAIRGVDAAVAYHGGDAEKCLGEVDGLRSPILMHLAEEDEFISKAAQAQIKAALRRQAKRDSLQLSGAASRLRAAQRRTLRRRGGGSQHAIAAQPNFSIANCGDVRSRQAISRKEGRIEWTADISR